MRKYTILAVLLLLPVLLHPLPAAAIPWTFDNNVHIQGNLTVDGTSPGGTATAIQDNLIVNADVNSSAAIDATKIADGTVTNVEFQYIGGLTSDAQTQLDDKAPLVSPSFTTPSLGVATLTTADSGQGATEIHLMDQNVRTTDNVIFNTVTAAQHISTATDNTRGVAVPNTADPTGSNLEAGLIWVTDNVVKARSNDNTITFSAGPMVKTFSFGIDNVVTGDDILLWKLARAATVTKVDCYASTDNVVGVLSECASDNVTSCTAVDSTDWTVTNAVTGFSVNSGFENPGIAAAAWLKWVTTSVGTTNSNKLSCTVQYRD